MIEKTLRVHSRTFSDSIRAVASPKEKSCHHLILQKVTIRAKAAAGVVPVPVYPALR
jgi:hypothetical protein